jgi:hypothetical protein
LAAFFDKPHNRAAVLRFVKNLVSKILGKHGPTLSHTVARPRRKTSVDLSLLT